MTHDSATYHATIGHNPLRILVGALLLAVATLAIAFALRSTQAAIAAPTSVAQCNNETASNIGGQGLRCTVTVVNYISESGSLADAPPSTVTMTKCTGAAGPIAAGAGTCTTTTSITVGEPVTSIQQCNGEGNGGGGVVICTATITNYIASSATGETTAATIYQCVDSAITGPGAPGVCSPSNTPGVSSIGAATVGQCNGSGNGGTSVGFTCQVLDGSTTASTSPVHIDQCNGSSNGGGALTICLATVTNQVLAPTPTATPPTSTLTPTTPRSTLPPTSPTSTLPPTSIPPDQSTPIIPGLVPPGAGTATSTPTPATPTGTPTLTPSPTPTLPGVSTTPESGSPPKSQCLQSSPCLPLALRALQIRATQRSSRAATRV